MDKLRLYGFNNLTKSLSLSIYDLFYADTPEQKRACLAWLDETLNADRLAAILTAVADTIGAQVLNVAGQDYEPEGASATLLIAEEPMDQAATPTTVVGHLDKSHISVHTYPECHSANGIVTLRADVDVATCGLISPLQALDYLLGQFAADVVAIDYRVRGFTRDVDGRKHFIDEPVTSIQDYLNADLATAYWKRDDNLPAARLFHTRMRIKKPALERYLFGLSASDLQRTESDRLSHCIGQEMDDLFRANADSLVAIQQSV